MKKLESDNTEYKQSWHDDHLKTVCAFASSDGGTMFIGKDDNGKTKGISDAKKLLEDIPNKIINAFGFVPDVKLKNKNGKQILAIKIKPYKPPISYRGKFYVRSGSTTQELKGTQLQRFLLEKSGQSWESVVEDRATLKDIDEETISHFKELALKRFPVASKEKSVSHLLEKLHLLHKGKLTRAAVLLFAKEPQKFYISAQIKIGRFINDTDLQSTDVVEGNLFQQAEKAMEILKNKYLVFNAHIEGLYRKEELEYPDEALREGILNAIIHKDYLGPHIQLRVHPDKLSLWNFGELPPELSIDRLKKQHRSLPRNKQIADVFYKAGLIESWGRGTIKIIEECKKAGLPEPFYEEEQGGINITFRKDVYSEEQMQKMGLNERQVKAVAYLKEYGKITNTQYQKICKTSKRTASNDLQELYEKKIIEKVGITGKGTQYIMQRGNKGAKGAKNGTTDPLDKKLSLLEKELNVIDPDEEVKQQFGSELFFHIYDTWFSDLLREIIPVFQKFNRYFKKPDHSISIINGIGYARFKNEKADDVIDSLRKESKKGSERIQSDHTHIKISASYRSFIKGGLKSFGCNYEIEIKFFEDWYEVYMDDEVHKRNHNLQYKRLYHKPLIKSEIKNLSHKLGDVIFEHISGEVKRIKEKNS